MNKKILFNVHQYDALKQEAEKMGITVTALLNLIVYNFLKMGLSDNLK